MAERPRVKICGVTRPEDAERAVALGCDLVGLNFWPGSPRAVTVEQAAPIAEAVRGRATLVGVFVDPSLEEVRRVVQSVGLQRVQLHGDEGPALGEALGESVLKVFRVRDRFDAARLDRWPRAWGFLFDCRHPRLYGGTGEGWRYEAVRDLPVDRPVLVAGGVRPETVGDVVRRCRPWGVDVCSGVESAPGLKDAGRLRRLMEEIAREATQEQAT